MRSIVDLLSSTVEQQGLRAALLEPMNASSMHSINYVELRKGFRGFAGYLQQHIQPGDYLITWHASRMHLFVAYLAYLQIGAGVVPLDANSLADFLHKVVSITSATILIPSRKQVETIPHVSNSCIDIDVIPGEAFHEGWYPIARRSREGQVSCATDEQAACSTSAD